MEPRLGRHLNTKIKISVLAGLAAVGSLAFVPLANAQLIDPRPPGEVKPSKPKVDLILPPKPVAPWVEPTDLDHLIDIASSEMGISSAYARKIVMCESEGDPSKINSVSGARGLWQIMPVHAEEFVKMGWSYWRDWANGYRNTKIAVRVKAKQGLSAWDCS